MYIRELVGVRTSVVNALRRIILAEVPYVATCRDDARAAGVPGGFTVRENTGRLHHDMLCDRVALVPIHLTRAELDNFIPGSITVNLRVANNGAVRRNVTSKDFETMLFGKPHPNAPSCFPPDPVTGDWPLVTRLYPGEKIDMTATLEKGTASHHAAFAVASCVSMKPSLDADAAREMRTRIEQDQTLSNMDRANALNYHDFVVSKQTLRLGSDGDPFSHTLGIETECGLSGEDIFNYALEVLLHKFTGSSLVYEATGDSKSIVLHIMQQGHTFGSVLQDLCLLNAADLGIRSVGYYETHPLEDRIVVRVDLSEPCADVDADDIISKMRVLCAREIERGLHSDARAKSPPESLQQQPQDATTSPAA